MPEKYKKIFMTAAIIFALMTATAAWVINSAESSREELTTYGTVPQFEFTERSGDTFGSLDMQGNICVVDFIFTSCKMACPIMSSKMSVLYRLFQDYPDVKFVSVSVDPDTDTLPVLNEYAKGYGVTDNRWVFLRAPIEDVINLSEQGFMLAAENLPMGHSVKFALVDKTGNIRGFYSTDNDVSMNILKDNIKTLLTDSE